MDKTIVQGTFSIYQKAGEVVHDLELAGFFWSTEKTYPSLSIECGD